MRRGPITGNALAIHHSEEVEISAAPLCPKCGDLLFLARGGLRRCLSLKTACDYEAIVGLVEAASIPPAFLNIEGSILGSIRGGPLTCGEIARKTGRATSSVKNALDRMNRANTVARSTEAANTVIYWSIPE